jgi:TPR repeat protein
MRGILAAALFLLAISQAGAEPLPGQREAAEAGDVRAQYALGIIYDTGSGVPIDYTEGFRWFRLSAEGGYAPAQAKMGLMYLYGWQERRDVAAAADWYERAAEQGDVRSQAQIAAMYARGVGVPEDAVAAYAWTAIAAQAGDAMSGWWLPLRAARLTAAELEEADARVRAWRPRR